MILNLFFITGFVFGQLPSLVLGNLRLSLLDIFAGFVGLLVIIRAIRRQWPPKSYCLSAIAWFVAAALLSLAVNIGRFDGVRLMEAMYLFRWVVYALVYVFILWESKLSARLPLMTLYLAGVAMAVIGLGQYWLYPNLRNLWYLGWDPHYRRLFSTLLDPNFAGIVLVLTFILGLFWLASAKRYKMLVSLSLVVVGAALLLTYSRSSYLAFIAGLLMWAALTRNWRKVVTIVAIFLLILLLLPKSGEGRNLARLTSTVARWQNWQEGLGYFRSAPFVGHGFYSLAEKQSPPEQANIPARAGAVIDNSLIFVAATTGLFGLGAYLWILVKMIGLGARLKRQDSNLGALLLASLAALLVHSQFINSLFYPWVMVWWWILAGITERTIRR